MPLKRLFAPIAAAALLAVPASLYAQAPPWSLPSASERYRSAADGQVPYYDARRSAYDEGYQQGVKEGQKDARAGDRYAYQDEREFQRADRGYDRRFGDRERYRQIFRDGFAAGYSTSYDRYARNGGNNVPYRAPSGPYAQRGPVGVYGGPGTSRYPAGSAYYSPAFDDGVRDGIEKGQEDARKARTYDVVRHEWYREGDRHYESSYGSKQDYKNLYRQGFQQGYDQGFRDGRYRR